MIPMRFRRRKRRLHEGPAGLGRRGEQVASRFLRRRGYRVLCKNFRCERGELDLVARHRHELVFVEVKTRRRGTLRGRPLDAVDRPKQRRMALAALAYLRLLGRPDVPFRFDVVEVWADGEGRRLRCQIAENAFLLPPDLVYWSAARPGSAPAPLPLFLDPGPGGRP